MRVFLDELQKRHRARFGALVARHKATIGYVILVAGLVLALVAVGKALEQGSAQRGELKHQAATLIVQQREAQHRDEVKSAIICENITRVDKQTLTNLHTKVDKELIKALGISDKVLKDSIHKQLVLSAEERTALQPSDPQSACFSGLTTLRTVVPPIMIHSSTSTVTSTLTTPRSTPSPAPRVTLPSRPRSVAPRRSAPVSRPILRSSPFTPPPPKAVSPPKAGGGTVPPVSPVKTEPLEPPIPSTVKVPPITVGPVTTPGVKVTVTK